MDLGNAQALRERAAHLAHEADMMRLQVTRDQHWDRVAREEPVEVCLALPAQYEPLVVGQRLGSAEFPRTIWIGPAVPGESVVVHFGQPDEKHYHRYDVSAPMAVSGLHGIYLLFKYGVCSSSVDPKERAQLREYTPAEQRDFAPADADAIQVKIDAAVQAALAKAEADRKAAATAKRREQIARKKARGDINAGRKEKASTT